MRHRSLCVILVFLFIGLAAGCLLFESPMRDEWYSQHYFIMQDWEKKIYRQLPQAGRQEFQRIFWDSREEQSHAEFWNRLEYVMTVYQAENKGQPWNTDRARVYLLNGVPFEIAYRSSESQAKSAPRTDVEYEDIETRQNEVWSYLYQNRFVYYTFNFVPPNQWRLNQTVYSDTYIGRLENYNRQTLYGITANEDQYRAELTDLLKEPEIKK